MPRIFRTLALAMLVLAASLSAGAADNDRDDHSAVTFPCRVALIASMWAVAAQE